jgi:hypothetical protein
LHAVEVNRVRDRNTFRIHRDVLPFVRPDMITFSAYESINDWLASALSQGQLEASIDTNMRAAARDVLDWNPGARLALTDWGWPETDTLFVSRGYNVAGLIAQALATATALGFEDAVYWQVWDNGGRGQDMYVAPSGTALSGAGTYLASL